MARNNLKKSNRGTSAADLAEHSEGYSPNGVSEWERNASNNAPRINPFKPVRFRGRRTLAQQIAECERRIAHMECELRLCERSEKEPSPARHRNLQRLFEDRTLVRKSTGRHWTETRNGPDSEQVLHGLRQS
jgi:hypothetical protein